MLLLLDAGVPWHQYRKWSTARRKAAVIATGERKSRTYDWLAGRWLRTDED
ncbi:MAG: hypothetical protein ACRYHQ_20090 [Janthinobacterium lividum]